MPDSQIHSMDSQCARTMLDKSGVKKHEFLRRMSDGGLSNEQVRQFAIQWFKAASAHKKAFPALIYNTSDDVVRFDLIRILRDEYGNGDVEYIHARLLKRFLHAVGISDKEVLDTSVAEEISEFSNQIENVWLQGHPVEAFGVHYALEFLASEMHEAFFKGLNSLNRWDSNDLEYFEYHGRVEAEHADISDRGFDIYCNETANVRYLVKGLNTGIDLMRLLWDGLNRQVFAAT
jgi:pyrroloquinoline-quinone synthase